MIFNKILLFLLSTNVLSLIPFQRKFISISPSGVYGFYTLGVSNFISKNYDISNYSYIGASSGSWNSLFCCYKYDKIKFSNNLIDQGFFDNPKSISNVQIKMYNYILDNYKTEDFDLEKLCISYSILKKLKLRNKIETNFESLEDALNCCLASCHIPFVTSNKFLYRYKENIAFDGGFVKFPPIDINNYFVISSNRFNSMNIKNLFYGLITRNISKSLIKDLYSLGYNNSYNNKKELNMYFNNNPFYFNIFL